MRNSLTAENHQVSNYFLVSNFCKNDSFHRFADIALANFYLIKSAIETLENVVKYIEI